MLVQSSFRAEERAKAQVLRQGCRRRLAEARGSVSRVSEDYGRVGQAGTSQTTSGLGEREGSLGFIPVAKEGAYTETTASDTVLIRQMQEADS